MSANQSNISQIPVFRSLSSATLQALKRTGVQRRFRVGELLLEGGARAEWLHVVEQGLVREFYVTAAGDEHTRVFVAEGGVTGSRIDLRSGAPAVTWIQAIEPTSTLAFRLAEFDALARQDGDLETLARRFAEALAIRKTRREYEMLALSAADRLISWRAENPGLDERITRRLLASYLGITPVHLSRISAGVRHRATEGPRERVRPPR